MDLDFFGEAMKAVGLKVVLIDDTDVHTARAQAEGISRQEAKALNHADQYRGPFSPLHATLRKCKCGYIASSHMVQKHIEDLLKTRSDVKAFWKYHGEVPLSQQEGENFQNRKWLEGTPRGYND